MSTDAPATPPVQLISGDQVAREMLQNDKEFGLTTHTDIQVSTGDIVEIVTTRFEKQVKKQLRAAEGKVKLAAEDVAAAEKALKDHCEAHSENYGGDKAELFEAAYTSIGLGFVYESEVTVGEKGYTISHEVYSSKKGGYSHGSHEHSAAWKTEVTFRKAGCIKLFNAIGKAEKAHEAAKTLQMDWRRKLTEIPDVERRARASLAERALGQSEGGQQLMVAISAAFNEEFGDLEELEPVALLEHADG